MREEQISINNLKINYKIAGEGPAILVLHGWGGSSDSWLKVQEILAIAGFKIIVPDFPGFGKSVTPPEPWDIQNYLDFVFNFVKDLKLDSFFLLGHSFGGRVAIKFSVLYPEKVKSLILCDSAGIKPAPGIKTRIIYWMSSVGNAIFSPACLRRFKDGARNLFYIFLRHKDYVRAKGVMKETIKKVLGNDLLEDLPKIKIKTLLVWGKKDRLVPLEYGRIFKDKIENSQLVILAGVGHSPHLEKPEKLAGIILKFLN